MPQKALSESSILQEGYSGWLWKKSGRFSGWKYRFFILRGAILTYYDKFPADEYFQAFNAKKTVDINPNLGILSTRTKSDTVPKGVLRIAHVEQSSRSAIAFKIYAVSGKVLEYRADTSQTCARWVDVLGIAARLGRRKEVTNYSYVSNSTDSCTTVGTNLSSFSEDEAFRVSNIVNKCGWLKLQDEKKMLNLYFVLQGKLLTYYENDLPWTVPKSRGYVVQINRMMSSSNTIQVALSVGKPMFLQAETAAECDLWHEALQTVLSMSPS